jgi:hypothetical protein
MFAACIDERAQMKVSAKVLATWREMLHAPSSVQ